MPKFCDICSLEVPTALTPHFCRMQNFCFCSSTILGLSSTAWAQRVEGLMYGYLALPNPPSTHALPQVWDLTKNHMQQGLGCLHKKVYNVLLGMQLI